MKIFSCALFLIMGLTQTVLAQDSYTVQGTITGLTGEARVYMSLQTKKNWESKGDDDITVGIILEASTVSDTGSAEFVMQAPPGKYMITFYEDIDGNDKITMGFFGPKEPYGFYRVFKGKLRRPRFKEISFDLNENIEIGEVGILKSKRKKSKKS